MQAALLWLQLLGSAVLILGSARYLTRSSDTIARRTGLGHTFAGMVLLATATSLPELGTGVSAIRLQDSPDLAAGAAFGSNLVNILIIGIADLVWRNGPLLSHVPRASLVVAGVGAGVILIASVATLVHHATGVMTGWYVSPLTAVLFAFFAASTFAVYRLESAASDPVPVRDEPGRQSCRNGEDTQDEPPGLRGAIAVYLAAALVVIASSVWLSYAGDRLADSLGWEESFVGTQFLAISTSLPEVATSLAALRIGSPALAVGNLLGSNLFNMGFIMSADELAVTGGTIWAAISRSHAITGLIAIAMTAVVVAALLHRSRRTGRAGGRWAKPEAALLIAMYVGASVGLFYAG